MIIRCLICRRRFSPPRGSEWAYSPPVRYGICSVCHTQPQVDFSQADALRAAGKVKVKLNAVSAWVDNSDTDTG